MDREREIKSILTQYLMGRSMRGRSKPDTELIAAWLLKLSALSDSKLMELSGHSSRIIYDMLKELLNDQG